VREAEAHDPGVAVFAGEAGYTRRRRRSGLLAVLLLLSPVMGACLVPENISAYQPPPAAAASPPVIDLGTVSPSDPVTCLDSTNVDTTDFKLQVDDALAKPLTARWFLNYSTSSPFPLKDPTKDSADFPLPANVELNTPDPGQTTIAYPKAVWKSGDLHLELQGPGVYTLEEVISDGFDPDPNDAPANRAPLPGSYVTSYKWAINYITGQCGSP
jgi:hypothetical protein